MAQYQQQMMAQQQYQAQYMAQYQAAMAAQQQQAPAAPAPQVQAAPAPVPQAQPQAPATPQAQPQAAPAAATTESNVTSAEKEAWFKQVYQQNFDTYKQQGGDDATCNSLATKGVEDYKATCLKQGISLSWEGG